MLTQDDLQAIRGIVKEEITLVNKKIEQSQHETIEALSELIHTGYALHDERITKIEEQLKSSQTH